MSQATILMEIRDGVALLTLNRPDRMNAFNAAMHAEMRDALAQVKASGARCCVLTGAGRAFCTGQDLADRLRKEGEPPPDLGASLDANYNRLIRLLKDLEMPVLAAVNGTAAGAGANLALAADIVIAARSASFIQSFCKVGLIPDSGGTWVLPRLVGTARATALMMLGEKVSAEQAEAWGMIWKCVDDDALLPTTMGVARHLAAQPTLGLALTRKALAASASNSLDQQLDLERDLQRQAGHSEDYREGVTAFMEKRPPRFQGR